MDPKLSLMGSPEHQRARAQLCLGSRASRFGTPIKLFGAVWDFSLRKTDVNVSAAAIKIKDEQMEETEGKQMVMEGETERN